MSISDFAEQLFESNKEAADCSRMRCQRHADGASTLNWRKNLEADANEEVGHSQGQTSLGLDEPVANGSGEQLPPELRDGFQSGTRPNPVVDLEEIWEKGVRARRKPDRLYLLKCLLLGAGICFPFQIRPQDHHGTVHLDEAIFLETKEGLSYEGLAAEGPEGGAAFQNDLGSRAFEYQKPGKHPVKSDPGSTRENLSGAKKHLQESDGPGSLEGAAKGPRRRGGAGRKSGSDDLGMIDGKGGNSGETENVQEVQEAEGCGTSPAGWKEDKANGWPASGNELHGDPDIRQIKVEGWSHGLPDAEAQPGEADRGKGGQDKTGSTPEGETDRQNPLWCCKRGGDPYIYGIPGCRGLFADGIWGWKRQCSCGSLAAASVVNKISNLFDPPETARRCRISSPAVMGNFVAGGNTEVSEQLLVVGVQMDQLVPDIAEGLLQDSHSKRPPTAKEIPEVCDLLRVPPESGSFTDCGSCSGSLEIFKRNEGPAGVLAEPGREVGLRQPDAGDHGGGFNLGRVPNGGGGGAGPIMAEHVGRHSTEWHHGPRRGRGTLLQGCSTFWMATWRRENNLKPDPCELSCTL